MTYVVIRFRWNIAGSRIKACLLCVPAEWFVFNEGECTKCRVEAYLLGYIQGQKKTPTSVLTAVDAFTVRNNKIMSVLVAWSAILKDAAPWRIPLREQTSSHLNLV